MQIFRDPPCTPLDVGPNGTPHFRFFLEHPRGVSSDPCTALYRDSSIPKLYKEIWEAEIACQMQINNDRILIFGLPITPTVKLHYICYLLATNKFGKELDMITTFWSQHFLHTPIEFGAVWKACKVSYVDGYTRSVHYLLLQKALYTRSRLSHFVLGMSDFCKVCIAQRETVIHVFLECQRAMDAWRTLEPIFLRITGENLNDNI